jgi:hypothetical protein
MNRQLPYGQQPYSPTQRIYPPSGGHNNPTEHVYLPSNGHSHLIRQGYSPQYYNSLNSTPMPPPEPQHRGLNNLQKRFLIVLAVVTIVSILLAVFVYEIPLLRSNPATSQVHFVPTPRVPTVAPPTPSPTLPPAPVLNPSSVLGIDSGPLSEYPGITWTRISYKTCGGDYTGNKLKSLVQNYQSHGDHVLLLLCQRPGKHLLDLPPINDVAQAGADAVACGNEEMKHNTYPTYVSPQDFARFFDLCERTVQAARPGLTVLLGSLDPHVGGIDYQPLLDQVNYLNAVEQAMNTQVHTGGNWSWRAQTMGLIDSWHNGFPNQSVNSLGALFVFWAQQFHVNLNSGALGKHIWVVEGTGCVTACGLYSNSQISIAHILTLITDVQTAMHYQVPFFYFSGRDFFQKKLFWPMGVLNIRGHEKPLRQDLSLGAKALTLSCPGGSVRVTEQEPLLAKLYSGCTLPANYDSILIS